MIPKIVQIADDELFSTWMDYILKINGAETQQQQAEFLNDLSGISLQKRSCDYLHASYFPRIEYICKIEEKSSLFPKLDVILKKHTDLYAMMPFRTKGETAKRMEYCLHGSANTMMYGKYGHNKTLKICPECAKEDEEHYGRQVIHVQHQLCIDICWKHGCVLQYMDTGKPVKESAIKQDMDKASFMHGLYEEPVISNFKMLRSAVQEEFSKADVDMQDGFKIVAQNGYITEQQAINNALKSNIPRANDDFSAIYIGTAVDLFSDNESFIKAVGVWDPSMEYSYEEFETILSSDILWNFRGKACGHTFYMNPVAAEYGTPCPECARKMSRTEIYQRHADRLQDGPYEVYEENRKTHIIHLKCGNDLANIFVSNVWNQQGCRFCRKKNNLEQHLGEQNINNAGRLMKITGWRTSTDIDITFSDGETVHGSYLAFKNGQISSSKDSKVRTNRLGETNVNRQGHSMKIVAYHSSQDVDIEFEDGSMAKGKTYYDFKRGTITPPHDYAQERVGEENINKQGIKMKIIAYRSCVDIDIEFETGDIVTGKRYESFKKGNIPCLSVPPAKIAKHLNEKGINKQGVEMKIIAYRGYKDLDVQFETGEIITGETYNHFKKGTILCPSAPPVPSAYKLKRIGETNVNSKGMKMKIIDYRTAADIDVEFENGKIKTTNYYSFKKGLVKCPD